jgi:LPS sulfotransferase NodH
VLSNPRSGSTAFRQALAVGGMLKDFGEIFHDNRTLTVLPFLDFLERWQRPLFAMIDWSECREISRAYVRQLKFSSYGQRPLIDIKHNAWSVLRPLWQFPHDEPVFMSALKDERAFFVQLKRENLADQVISYIIAQNTDIWHAQVTAFDIPENLAGKRIDPALVRRLCELFAMAEALTEKFLSAYPRRLTLTYEQVFSDGMLSAEAARRVSKAIGIEIRPAVLPLRPNMVANREVITNYDELREIAASVKAAQANGQ